jgi:hypothetical protein
MPAFADDRFIQVYNGSILCQTLPALMPTLGIWIELDPNGSTGGSGQLSIVDPDGKQLASASQDLSFGDPGLNGSWAVKFSPVVFQSAVKHSIEIQFDNEFVSSYRFNVVPTAQQNDQQASPAA